MTLDTSVSKALFKGNGAATEFPFSFRVWDAAELIVQVTGADGAARDVTAQCSIVLSDEGGVVTYAPGGEPLPAGQALVILRNMSFLQDVKLITGTRFDPAVIEEALDRATAERQQLLEKVSRAIVVPADSADPPEELADQIFEARDRAEAAAGNAAASVAKAAREADRAAAEVDRALLAGEKEVARAAGEADRARREADRAAQSIQLGVGADNLEGVWRLDTDIPVGGTLTLPVSYFPGRAMLHLSYDGVELYRAAQYEEIGEAGGELSSSCVKMLIPLPAGTVMHAWAIASNVARHVEEAEERARAEADRARQEANRAENGADRAHDEADRAEVSRNVAQNAAQEATEQADRADEAAIDAGRYRNEALGAAKCAAASVQGRSIAAVQSADLLDRVPSGFFVIDPDLVLPATIQQPLTPVASVEDIPNMDGFFLVVPPFPDCPPDPEPEPESDPGPDEPDEPDNPGGNNDWTLPCGKRARV